MTRIARQRRRRRNRQGASAPRVLRWGIALLTATLGIIVLSSLLALTVFALVYNHYARQLPPPEQITVAEEEAFLTTVIYERTGEIVLYEVIDPQGGDRRWVSTTTLPQYVLDATVAIEDTSFYDNPGFDLRGMTRAMWSNLTGGQLQGGSTITQQLVRNVLFTADKRHAVSYERKIKEVILAAEISRLYSKEQILEWYVNTNFYGGWAYGIEAAAQQYFNKPARDLSLAEAAMLAAFPQYPLQNPIDNPNAAKLRQGLVLQTMVEEGYLTQAQADAAFLEPLIVRPFADRFDLIAPHFATYARAEAEAILNDIGLDGPHLVTRGGLRIYTTLDLDLQLQAECVARSHVARLDGADPLETFNTSMGTPCAAAMYLPPLDPEFSAVDREVTNASVVVLRAETGEILSMVGSVDYWNEGIQGNYNATLAQRQPASTFKPVVYTAAFLQGALPGYPNGITAATMTYDVQLEFDNGGQPYTPVNIDRQYHGPISVRDALANSYNVPPVQLANLIGLGPIFRTAHRLGINSLTQVSDYGLALALGSGEASLLDMTYTYNVFNMNGTMVGMPVYEDEGAPGFRTLNPVAVLRIEDADGRVLWEYGTETSTYQKRLVLEPALAYIMTHMLADTAAREPAFGRDNPLDLARPAAAKTGTTNDNRDSWTIGYTPQIVTGVWVGNNNNNSMFDVTGITGAAPIWHAVMAYAHTRDALPRVEWPRPDTVIERVVCQTSGLLPTRYCPQTREIFYADSGLGIDTQPVQADSYWNNYDINVCTGRLANASSPPGCVEEMVFFDYPQEVRTWARETNQRFPPSNYDIADTASPFNPVTIISPPFLARIGGVVDVRGNISDADFAYFRLDCGAGPQPDVWLNLVEQGTDAGRDIVLGTWDTTTLSEGAVYTLRLTMVRTNNTRETAFVSVTVDNRPPLVALTAPAAHSVYRLGEDVYIPLEAEPDDNVQVAYVEFYQGDTLVATREEWPYTARVDITSAGEKTFWVAAYDAAGNRTASGHVTVTVIGADTGN
ncbi:MAG: transglycosylase domain-containing protein [Anaerolineae bacterium]|nr:transglycosylase domain-containing protein [Anaerolineae bacterium]